MSMFPIFISASRARSAMTCFFFQHISSSRLLRWIDWRLLRWAGQPVRDDTCWRSIFIYTIKFFRLIKLPEKSLPPSFWVQLFHGQEMSCPWLPLIILPFSMPLSTKWWEQTLEEVLYWVSSLGMAWFHGFSPFSSFGTALTEHFVLSWWCSGYPRLKWGKKQRFGT